MLIVMSIRTVQSGLSAHQRAFRAITANNKMALSFYNFTLPIDRLHRVVPNACCRFSICFLFAGRDAFFADASI
jgi:phage gp36-like protein